MSFGFLYDGYVSILCKSEIFKFHGFADEAICAALEDIKVILCAFGVEVVGCVEVMVVHGGGSDDGSGNAFATCIGRYVVVWS